MKFYVQLLANTFFNWMKWTIFKENKLSYYQKPEKTSNYTRN